MTRCCGETGPSLLRPATYPSPIYTGAVLAVRTTAGGWRDPPGGEQRARLGRVSSRAVGWRRSVHVGGGATGRRASHAAEFRSAAAAQSSPPRGRGTGVAGVGLGAGHDAAAADHRYATPGPLVAALAPGRRRLGRGCPQPGRPPGTPRQEQELGR